MAELADIRAGIAGLLNAALPDFMCTGYNLPNAYAPSIEVEPDRIVYDMAGQRGLDEWFFTLRVFAASGTDVAAQQRLDPLLNSTGSQSIKAIVEADRTLGGSVSDARIIGLAKVRVFSTTSGDVGYYGAELTLRVLAAGD